MKYRILLLAAALGFGAQPAAADVYWSSIASACVADSVSIQNDRYQLGPTDNIVAPKTGKVDPVILICGVQPNPNGTNPTILSMTYQDATGTAASALVQADLVRVTRNNGARSVITTAVSNTSNVKTQTKLNKTFSHALNFDTGYYYVRILLDRSLANENVRSIGVALE